MPLPKIESGYDTVHEIRSKRPFDNHAFIGMLHDFDEQHPWYVVAYSTERKYFNKYIEAQNYAAERVGITYNKCL